MHTVISSFLDAQDKQRARLPGHGYQPQMKNSRSRELWKWWKWSERAWGTSRYQQPHLCGVCDMPVKDCMCWFHPKCAKLSNSDYNRLADSRDPWLCKIRDTFSCHEYTETTVDWKSTECCSILRKVRNIQHVGKIKSISEICTKEDKEVLITLGLELSERILNNRKRVQNFNKISMMQRK